MKIGDRFKRTHSMGSVSAHYQRGYESSIADIQTIRGVPSIIDTNGHEHYVSYIEVIRDPLAEIDDLKAQITALREMLLTPYVGHIYFDTSSGERWRITSIDVSGDRIGMAFEGVGFTEHKRYRNIVNAIKEGRFVRIPG